MLVAAARPLSLAQYAAALAEHGVRVVPGESGTFWIASARGAMLRIPFVVGAPAANELRRVLWRGQAAIASYLLPADEHHPANVCHYVCADPSYTLDRMSPPMRRNVRRGLGELRIAQLSAAELLAHGLAPFSDTRRRLGLADGTAEVFQRRFHKRAQIAAHVFLGAWRGDALAGFLSITEIDGYAEIEGSFATDAHRPYRPSDTLLYWALHHYLVERNVREVSYGLSSIQAESNAAGLHRFKLKVGFEARPVHRAFVAHPLLRPFINRATSWILGRALALRPGDPYLKKADGMLACMLGRAPDVTARILSESPASI
jgi:hypothetical protein